jgi:hypothetical protein
VQVTYTLTMLAAKLSAWDQLKRVPKQTWINLIICVVALIVIVRVWRGLKKFNDYAPYFAAVLAASMIFFYWVYNRAEPAFLTPLVDRLAPFFPTKSKQEADLERMRRTKEI